MPLKKYSAKKDDFNRVREFQRRAQCNLDFIIIENSVSFHSPLEAV